MVEWNKKSTSVSDTRTSQKGQSFFYGGPISCSQNLFGMQWTTRVRMQHVIFSFSYFIALKSMIGKLHIVDTSVLE